MLIREWMTKDVITVTPDTSMLKASKLMKDHNIRRLPVLDGKHVVGIVSDRDIRAASPSKATTLDMHELYYLLSEVKVKDIMTSDPVTVYDTDAVDAAALLMENKGIGGLVRVGQFPSAAGEIVVLDVDQEKCRIHAVPPGVVPTIAACGGKYSSYFVVGMPSAAGMMPLRSKMPARPLSSMYSTPISCMIRTACNSFSPRSVRK